MCSRNNNINICDNKAETPQSCEVLSEYYDPINLDEKNLKQEDEITQDKKVIRMDPKFTGYFGLCRWDKDLKKIRTHTGYDYVTSGEKKVIAVQSGCIERIRFGRIPINCYYEKKGDKYYKMGMFICPLYELFKKGTFSFDHNTCKGCKDKYILSETDPPKGYKQWKTYQIVTEIINVPEAEVKTLTEEVSEKKINKRIKWNTISSGCFGVQVWLKIRRNLVKIKNNAVYYAFYAHLSELNMKVFSPLVFSEMTDIFAKKTSETGDCTINLNPPIYVDAGTVIGNSGCTGNAWNMTGDDQHLHFECRTGDGKTETQISPNKIVKTSFVIRYTGEGDENKPSIEKIKRIDFIDYLTEKDDINKEIENRINEAVSNKIQNIIDNEWVLLKKKDNWGKNLSNNQSNKYTYDKWEKFQNRWYPVRNKKERSEVWKELYGEDPFDIYEHKRWINNFQDCEKQWSEKRNKKGEENKEYHNFVKKRFDEERKNNEDTYKQEIKKESIEKIKKTIIDKDWEKKYEKEENAIVSFRNNHKLIVGEIRGCQNHTQEVTGTTPSP